MIRPFNLKCGDLWFLVKQKFLEHIEILWIHLYIYNVYLNIGNKILMNTAN